LVKPVANHGEKSGALHVACRRLPGLAPYEETIREMEQCVIDIRGGAAREQVWLLEHPPLYTAGTSAKAEDLLDERAFPVHSSGRGGQYTYHGPGQRVAYLMLDLGRRGRDVRSYVRSLEQWLIAALARLGVNGELRAGRVGVWVRQKDGSEAKIAAIGVRIRRWVSMHGVAVNLDPELAHFEGIAPCGLRQYGVTSLRDLGVDADMAELDRALAASFAEIFGSPLRCEDG
jgi:lipoyl(octanoyl) transferase